MFINILWLLAFVAVVVLFAWLTRRAWRAKNVLVKLVGVVLAG